MKWAHKTEPTEPHEVDPHYAPNGLPAYWVCHTCRTPLSLDGGKPPVTTPTAKAETSEETTLSSQP